jgi:hypothetical protein
MVISVASLAACGIGEPPPIPYIPPSGYGGSGGHGGTGGSGGTDDHKDDAPAPPTVDPVASGMCGSSAPISGTAEPGVAIIIRGGSATGGTSTDPHPQTGRYCADVPLTAGQSNTLQLQALAADGQLSETVTITVLQKDCSASGNGDTGSGSTTPEDDSRNVALGAEVKSLESPKLNNGTFVTDGSETTFALYEGQKSWGVWDSPTWITLKMDAVHIINKIVVRWRDSKGVGDEYYGADYKVLVSSESNPGDASITNGRWVEVGTKTGGVGGTDIFYLQTTQPLAQHVALWLEADGGWSNVEQFAIAEVEVWNKPLTSSQPSDVPVEYTCQSGGY